MKKNTICLLTALALSPFLTHCASQSDVDKLDYQLRVVNKKIDDMKMETVGKMQQRQASSISQIDILKKETMVLRGQLEEMIHFNRQLTEQNKELEASFKQYSTKMIEEIEKERNEFSQKDTAKQQKIEELEKRLSQQQFAVKKIQDARLKEKQLKAASAARAAEKAKARALASKQVLRSGNTSSITQLYAEKKKIYGPGSNKASTATNTSSNKTKNTTTSSNIPSADLFSTAEKAYTNGNYDKALNLYSQFLAKNKNSDKAITAKFMMGETLFQKKEYNQAILEYQQIISKHPGHARAATSFLKQGLAFEQLKEFETAKVIYKKIINSYSSSPEAITAKERNDKLQTETATP